MASSVLSAEEVVGAVLLHGPRAVLATLNTAPERTAPSLTMLTARKDFPGPGSLFSKEGNQAGA